jgi:MraZ protein
MRNSGEKWEEVEAQRSISFRGLQAATLDDKGRLAIPKRFRETLQQVCNGDVVLTIDVHDACLLMYPLAVWQDIEAKLMAMPNMDPATRRVQRLLLGHAVDMGLDSAGRILIPDLLREHAQIGRDVMLVGQGNKIEFWSSDVWQQQRDEWIATTRAEMTHETITSSPLAGMHF